MLDLFTDKKRIETFSDGIFAIAITLLGLELKIPRLNGAGSSMMWHTLGEQRHTYVAIIISFVTILLTWIYHHAIITQVKTVSYSLLFANGIFLLTVICFPFATGLVGAYFATPAGKAVSALYAGLCFFANLSFYFLWLTVKKSKGPLSPTERKVFKEISRNFMIGLGVYTIAFASAYVSATLCMGICVGLWLFWGAKLNKFKELP